MKKECEIVQDLLFGYQDGTLHMASKELVEKHLKSCKECSEIFREIKNDGKEEEEQKEEVDYLKKVNKKIGKKNKLLMVVGIILGMIILFNIFIFIYYYHEAGKISIYLKDDITEEQMENIKTSILNIDKNAKIEYYSKNDALEKMKERFKDRENLLSGYGETNNPLPAYYVIETSLENAKKIDETIMTLEGVEKTTGSLGTNPYEFMLRAVFV